MIKVWFGSVQHFMLLEEVPWTYTPQSCRRPKGVLPSVVLQYANLPLGCWRGTGTCLRRGVVFPVCAWATRRAPHPGGTMVISGHCCSKRYGHCGAEPSQPSLLDVVGTQPAVQCWICVSMCGWRGGCPGPIYDACFNNC